LVQPVGQTCSIDNVDTNPFPRIIDENDSASRVVDITCIDDPLHVTVNVTGLSDADGTLLAVTLNGNSTPLEFTPTSAISQTFSNTVLSHNDTYTVSITNQPDEVGQTCSIESVDTNRFPRRIDAADPASQVVRIICADDPFNVSVDVSGLSAATGTLLVVMLDGDNTPLEFTPGSSNTQTFSGTVLHHGDPYTVSITDQPGEVGQTCTIGNTDTDPFPRTIDAANGGSRVVNISCVSDPFTVSINVSGLSNDPVTLLQVSIDSDPVPLTFDDTSPGSQSFTTGLIYDTPYTVAIIDQPNEVNQYCEIVQADASAPTIYSDIINTNDVVLNIQCGPRPSINNLVYNECAAPLPNQDIDTRCGNWDVDGDGIVDNEDSDPTNDTGLLACIKAGAAANQWQYVDEVTVIDCNTSLIEHPDKLGNIPPTMVGRWLVDDPRIDFLNQFENLQVLDLGKNPLRQVAVTLFDLKNSSSSNFLPNIRYINTLDNDRFPTINITFNMEGLHVANVPFAADLRSFIAIDGVTYSNNGTPANSNDDFIVESFNVNADEEVFFDCPRSLTNPNECNCPDTDGDHFCDTFEFTVQGEMWGYDLQFFSMELGGQRCQSNPSSLPNVNEINGPNYSATVTCESAFPEVNNVPDPNLKKCLIDETVTSHTLEATNITSLFCDDQNVQSLAGIENFTSLNTLSVEHPRFDDLEPIRSLPNLTYLSIFYSDPESFIRVDDLINQGVFPDQGLQNCLSLIGSSYAENVRNLDCSGFNISDLTGIERLYGLETINLSNNNIQDISPLGLLTVHPLLIQSPLRKLNLANNNIADITPLNDLLYLENVNLSGNTGIADSSVLSTFTASQRQMGWIDGVNLNGEAQRNFTLQVTTGGQIQLNATPISTFYEPFLNIRVFDLTDTEMVPNAGVFTLAEGIYKITVVEDLCGCLGSVALDVAGVGATPGEAHFVSNIVALDLARSSLGDITPISELASVGYLDLSDNPGIVSDVALLSQLPAMAFLDLTNNVNMVNGGSLVLPGVNGGQDAFDRPNVFTSSETPSAFLIVGNNTYSITDTTEVVLDPNNVNNDLLSGVPDLVTGKTVSASFNVDLHLATPNPTDYVVTLTSPNGTTITLCNQNCTGFEINGNFPNDFPANFGPIIGEPLEGTWTLFIDDQIVEAGDPGDSLESWSISN
jgi:internalin A